MAALNMADHMFRKQVEKDGSPPTLSEFQTAIKVPQSKVIVGCHHISSLASRHVHSAPPYMMLCHARQDGQLQVEWVEMRISLLYKKGDPTNVGNYRPSCMYHVLCKILLPPMNTLLIAILPPNEARGRKDTMKAVLERV